MSQPERNNRKWAVISVLLLLATVGYIIGMETVGPWQDPDAPMGMSMGPVLVGILLFCLAVAKWRPAIILRRGGGGV